MPPAIRLSTDGVTYASPGARLAFPANSTVYAKLDSIANVDTTAWAIESTDDVGTSLLSLSLVGTGIVGEQVQFTCAGLGTSFILKAITNNGVDKTTGNVDLDATTAYIKGGVLTAGGLWVPCFNEELVSGTQGWGPDVNAAIRAVPGPSNSATGFASTTGPASTVLLSVPIPATWAALFDFRVIGFCAALPGLYATASPPGTGEGTGGSPTTFGPSAPTGTTTSTTGLPCSSQGSYAAGNLTVTVRGPTTTVSAAADNGSGKVRLTVAGPIDNTINGQSVTLSGLTVCTEANGAHVAQRFDDTHIDLPSVAIVHTGADSGTVVYTTPPVVKWAGRISTLMPLP